MKIGIAGPVEINLLKNHLAEKYHDKADRVRGLGGGQVTQLVQEYLRLGHEVSVYTLDSTLSKGKELKLEGEKLKIYVGSFRRGKRVTLDFQSFERRSLLRFMLSDRPEVIHAHWTYEFAQAAIASDIPHVITVRDWAPAILRLMPKPYRLMRLIMNFITLRKAENLSANSPYIAKKLERYCKQEIFMVPNGISDAFMDEGGKTLNQATPVVISISNGFGKLKNIKSLILAHEIHNKQRTTKTRLRLIGKGLERGGLANKWAVDNGIDDSFVSYVGPLSRDKVMEELTSADLMVHPALEESFGNTLVEAMATGVPVIAGERSGATAWVLDNGKAGKLVDVRSPKQIALAIDEILNDEQIWSYYSKAGFARAQNDFGMKSIALRYINLLERVRIK
jgi:glycosyltransferase involved in cell wall biosynthesis